MPPVYGKKTKKKTLQILFTGLNTKDVFAVFVALLSNTAIFLTKSSICIYDFKLASNIKCKLLYFLKFLSKNCIF